jgi:hypothetical protein
MSCYDIFYMNPVVNFMTGQVQGSRTILGFYSGV